MCHRCNSCKHFVKAKLTNQIAGIILKPNIKYTKFSMLLFFRANSPWAKFPLSQHSTVTKSKMAAYYQNVQNNYQNELEIPMRWSSHKNRARIIYFFSRILTKRNINNGSNDFPTYSDLLNFNFVKGNL